MKASLKKVAFVVGVFGILATMIGTAAADEKQGAQAQAPGVEAQATGQPPRLPTVEALPKIKARGSGSPGTCLVMTSMKRCNSEAGQEWLFLPMSESHWLIKNAKSRDCLDAGDVQNFESAPIYLSGCHSGDGGQWWYVDCNRHGIMNARTTMWLTRESGVKLKWETTSPSQQEWQITTNFCGY